MENENKNKYEIELKENSVIINGKDYLCTNGKEGHTPRITVEFVSNEYITCGGNATTPKIFIYYSREINSEPPQPKPRLRIPKELAHYRRGTYYLNNPYRKHHFKQQMFYSTTHHMINIFSVIHDLEVQELEWVDVTDFSELKKGDLVRFTNEDDWSMIEEKKDKRIKVIFEISIYGIKYQHWDEKHISGNNLDFNYWKHWQVARPVKEERD